jgi:hypothetical protein
MEPQALLATMAWPYGLICAGEPNNKLWPSIVQGLVTARQRIERCQLLRA